VLVAAALLGAALLLLAAVIAVGWFPGVGRPDYAHGISAGDLASLAVAGATLLLADFTAILARLTGRSLAATRREAKIAEDALAAANKQAALTADLVAATNEQARIAREQLALTWRPLLADPWGTADPQRGLDDIEIRPTLDQPFAFVVTFANIGAGPAFVKKGLFMLGSAAHLATDVKPAIVARGSQVRLYFDVYPKADGVQNAIAVALAGSGVQPTVGAFYHDIGGERAWRTGGRLVKQGTYQWRLVDVEVADVGLEYLK
jgi:hypothetical protein